MKVTTTGGNYAYLIGRVWPIWKFMKHLDGEHVPANSRVNPVQLSSFETFQNNHILAESAHTMHRFRFAQSETFRRRSAGGAIGNNLVCIREPCLLASRVLGA
jgi:hypothetical protein